MTQQPPQKRFLVNASFYVFAESEKEFKEKCKTIEQKVNSEYDGSVFSIDNTCSVGFAEIIKSH